MAQDPHLQQLFEAQASELQVYQLELEAQNEELRQTNLELELTRNQYADLFESAPLGYVVCDAEGLIGQVNALGCSQVGAPRPHLIGRLFFLFVDPPSRPLFVTLLEQVLQTSVLSGGPHRTELQMRRPDGSRWDAQVECTPLITPSGWQARIVLTDITALKTAQREAEERTREAHHLAEELQTFLRAMTQDLTAPQRQIQGFAERLAQSLTPADAQSATLLKHLLTAASDLGVLTTRLTEFFQSTQPSGHPSLVNLNHLVTGLVHDLAPQSQGRQVVLTHDPLPTLLVSAQHIRLVFSPLLSNAVKFTATRSEAQIHVGVQDSAEHVLFSVRDNGVGFDPAQSGRLFGLFERLHNARDFRGQGLGLALVKRVVQRLGGQVWAESVPGEGAVFWLQLPRSLVAGAAVENRESQQNPPADN